MVDMVHPREDDKFAPRREANGRPKKTVPTESARKDGFPKVKYCSVPWNKKTSIKTYSKTRPCFAKEMPYAHDNVFKGFQNGGSIARKNDARNLPCVKSTWRQGYSRDGNGNARQGKSENVNQSECFDFLDTIGSNDGSSISDRTKGQEKEVSPKNSTCLEGGDKINNALTMTTMLSPIKVVDKTNYEALPMDFTMPYAAPERNPGKGDCLSTIGGSSQYILAALMKKNKKKPGKYTPMSLIRKRAGDSRKQRQSLLTQDTPKTSQISQRKHIFKTPCNSSKFKDTVAGTQKSTERLVNSQKRTPQKEISNSQRTILELCDEMENIPIKDACKTPWQDKKTEVFEAVAKRPLLEVAPPAQNSDHRSKRRPSKEQTLPKAPPAILVNQLPEALKPASIEAKNDHMKQNVSATEDTSHSSTNITFVNSTLTIQLKSPKVLLERTLLEDVRSIGKSNSSIGNRSSERFDRNSDTEKRNLQISRNTVVKSRETTLEVSNEQCVGKRTPVNTKQTTKRLTSHSRRKGTLMTSQEVTPDEKENTFDVLKERLSVKTRRSLRFQLPHGSPDYLLTVPVDRVNYIRQGAKRLKRAQSRINMDRLK